jgi:hypothetical protein
MVLSRIECLWMGFGLVIGFIEHLLVVTTSNCNSITSSHAVQFTTAHMKSFQILKVCASLISHPLTHICSHSLLLLLLLLLFIDNFH